jgi:antitoxin component HigA of HigAB toxin-antitoxin module
MKMKTKAVQRWAFDNDVTWVMVSREAGVSKSQVSHVVNNRRTDTGDAVRNVLCFYGCPAECLGTDGEQRK